MTGSDSTLISSSLAESLTEFAGFLGRKEEGVEEWEWLDGQEEGEGLGGEMYNPFDPHGNWISSC